MAIKLITDSASDINEAEAKEMGITMIPMIIGFGDEEFFDGVDLLPTQFYKRLIGGDMMPKTAQITPFRFEEAFAKATENGDEVIVILISSKLSGTCEAAKKAAEKFNGKVFVLDSYSATVGERLLVQYALRLIEKGVNAKEVFEELERAKEKLVVMGVLETLEYLKKGGRISGAVAFVGGVLNLKPIVKLVDGEVKMVGKARGQKKGGEWMNGLVKSCGGIDFSMPYGALFTGLEESIAQKYIEESKEIWEGRNEVPAYVVGSTIGTHVGPGVFGLAFFEK